MPGIGSYGEKKYNSEIIGLGAHFRAMPRLPVVSIYMVFFLGEKHCY